MTHLVLIDPLLVAPGDRLTLEEFLEKRDQMPDLKFAELIDAVVYMPSPLSYDHGRRDRQMGMLLSVYAAKTGTCESIGNATWLIEESARQPDMALRWLPEYGGRTTVPGKLAKGAPELVAEICRSSRSYDLGPKLALYQRACVQEYIAVLIEEQRIEYRVLENGSYRMLQPDESGVYRSPVFAGLWIDEPAFWAGDGRRMLETLHRGLATRT